MMLLSLEKAGCKKRDKTKVENSNILAVFIFMDIIYGKEFSKAN